VERAIEDARRDPVGEGDRRDLDRRGPRRRELAGRDGRDERVGERAREHDVAVGDDDDRSVVVEPVDRPRELVRLPVRPLCAGDEDARVVPARAEEGGRVLGGGPRRIGPRRDEEADPGRARLGRRQQRAEEPCLVAGARTEEEDACVGPSRDPPFAARAEPGMERDARRRPRPEEAERGGAHAAVPVRNRLRKRTHPCPSRAGERTSWTAATRSPASSVSTSARA